MSDQAKFVGSIPSTQPQPQMITLLARSFGYLRPYKQYVAGIYLVMLLISGLNLAIPQLIRWIVDEGIIAGDFPLVRTAVIGLLGATLVKGFFVFFQGKWSETVSQYVASDLRYGIQKKLTELSFSFHDRTEAGQILSRTMQDVERIRFLTGRAVLRILESLILLVATAAILMWMNLQLGVLVAMTLPFILHRAYVFGKAIRPLSIRVQHQLGMITTRLEQNLRGIRVVKAFNQEDAEIERFVKENEKWFSLSALAARLESLNAPLLDFISNLGSVIVLWYGGRLVIQGSLSIGELVAFMTYLAQLYRPVRLFGRIIPIIAIAASAAERIFEILDAESEVSDRPDAIELPPIRGEVKFDKVCFGYRNGHQVLTDLSFEVKPGQMVALLGATGSGKSTVINLISRFYEPTSGQISIDGFDTRNVTLASLRNQIGIVLQDTTLFAASVQENIIFGRPDASDEEMIAAAISAEAHDFIMDMQDGYQSRIGERGMTLSGGQKQRIALARALLSDPKILILDDATASVDSETERKIQQAMQTLMQGRTTFVIAHRLSTVRKADLILFLHHGEIIAKGTHTDLLENPLYAEVYRTQLPPEERTPVEVTTR